MSILLDAEASFSKFFRNQIMGLVWFNFFNSWNPEGREWSSLQFCAWHFLIVKCPSGNKSHKNAVSSEAAAECQDRMLFYWVTYQPLGMHLCLLGLGGRMTKNTYIGKLEENPGAIPGSFPEEVGEVRQHVLNKCSTVEIVLNQTGSILYIILVKVEWYNRLLSWRDWYEEKPKQKPTLRCLICLGILLLHWLSSASFFSLLEC